MGLFAWSFDIDSLRALAYARLRIAAGEGLESVITHLQSADLGLVSQALRVPVRNMKAGEDARAVLQAQMASHPKRSYRELLACLLAEGPAALRRMDELSDEIQSDRKTRTEQYAKSMEGRLKFMAILFVVTYAQVFAQIFEAIPDNPIVPTFTLPVVFLASFYTILTLVMLALVISCRFSE